MEADQEHQELITTVKQFSEDMEKKYEEKIAKLTFEKDDDDNPTLAKLKEMHIEIKDMISKARKLGKDIFVAEITLKAFPPKLAMAKATLEREDIKKAEEVLKDAKKEVEDALAKEEVDFRADIEGFSTRSQESRLEKKQMAQEISGVQDINLIPKVDDREVKRKFRYFHCHNDKNYNSMADLAIGLRKMTEETFKYHVTAKVNDFAKWIDEVFEKGDLAKEVTEAKTKEEMADIIEKAIE